MGFTAPTETNWRSAAFINEIRAGIIERFAISGPEPSDAPEPLPLAAVGDSAQSATANFRYMQYAIERMAGAFLDHRAGDYTGLTEFPCWQVADSGAAHYLFGAFPTPQVGWRRQVVRGTFVTGGGGAHVGDLIGPWLYEDLQRALALLLWAAFQAIEKVPNDIALRQGDGVVTTSWSDAKGAAETQFSAGSTIDPGYIMAYSYGEQTTGQYWAEAVRRWGLVGKWDLPSLASVCDFDMYSVAGEPDHDGGTDYTFDANGDGMTLGVLAKMGTDTQAAVGSAVMVIGQETLPAWCNAPALNQKVLRGYVARRDLMGR
jgi:hypothetical protein